MDFQHVVSVRNMRLSDAKTIETKISSQKLMYLAAKGIYDSAQFKGRVAIVCGSGNNGGDGYALAGILCENGITPTIFRVNEKFSSDGLYYYRKARSLGAEEAPLNASGALDGFDIIVDCLLGTGFSGELKDDMRAAVELINNSTAFIISADINSGLNGDTGTAKLAVYSDLTVSIGAFKTGMFLNDAPKYIDKLRNVDIGIEIIQDEYKLLDYSFLYMFEGYGSEVISLEDFITKYALDRDTDNIVEKAAELSADERRTIVVKTRRSAVVADLKYVYLCAEYVG